MQKNKLFLFCAIYGLLTTSIYGSDTKKRKSDDETNQEHNDNNSPKKVHSINRQFHLALLKQNIPEVIDLLSKGADINHQYKKTGDTALHFIYRYNLNEISPYIIDNPKLDPTIKNYKGEKADPNSIDSDDDYNILNENNDVF